MSSPGTGNSPPGAPGPVPPGAPGPVPPGAPGPVPPGTPGPVAPGAPGPVPPGAIGSSARDRQSGLPIAREGADEASGLEVRELVVHYRDDDGTVALAVDGVSIKVAPGEVLALLGPSGSGKSTLLRAIAGLERPTSGSISWDGADLAEVPVHRRGFGLMFQDGQLFAHRSVARNVSFGLEMARVPRTERRARVAELLAVVGLEGFGDRDVASLSGGERQRVALARALAPEPALLLLDEPLSALDRALREHLAAEVRSALKATGTAAVFVTHDHDEAFAVADRIAVLDNARLLQVDSPVALWRGPATTRVAEFLGFEAFVPLAELAWLEGAPGTAVVRGAPEQGKGADDGGARADAAPVLAVGPGALRIDPEGPLVGRVVASGFRRGVTHTAVDVAGLGEVTVLSQGAELVMVEPGADVRLGRAPDGAGRGVTGGVG